MNKNGFIYICSDRRDAEIVERIVNSFAYQDLFKRPTIVVSHNCKDEKEREALQAASDVLVIVTPNFALALRDNELLVKDINQAMTESKNVIVVYVGVGGLGTKSFPQGISRILSCPVVKYPQMFPDSFIHRLSPLLKCSSTGSSEILTIKTKQNCLLYVDSIPFGHAEEGETLLLSLNTGKHRVKCVSAENDELEETVDMNKSRALKFDFSTVAFKKKAQLYSKTQMSKWGYSFHQKYYNLRASYYSAQYFVKRNRKKIYGSAITVCSLLLAVGLWLYGPLLLSYVMSPGAAQIKMKYGLDYVGEDIDGYRVVGRDSLYGYYSAKSDSIVLQPSYAEALDFHYSMGWVKDSTTWKMVKTDSTGRGVDVVRLDKSSARKESANSSEAAAYTLIEDGVRGASYVSYKLTFPAEIAAREKMDSANAVVYCIMDQAGNTVIPGVLEEIGDVRGKFVVARYNGKWGLIAINDFVADRFVYDKQFCFDDSGLAIVQKDEKFGIIDEQKELLELNYDSVKYLKNNCYAVDKGGKQWMLFRPFSMGEQWGTEEYDDIGDFSLGYAPACNSNKWGFINAEGQPVLVSMGDELFDSRFVFDSVGAMHIDYVTAVLCGDACWRRAIIQNDTLLVTHENEKYKTIKFQDCEGVLCMIVQDLDAKWKIKKAKDFEDFIPIISDDDPQIISNSDCGPFYVYKVGSKKYIYNRNKVKSYIGYDDVLDKNYYGYIEVTNNGLKGLIAIKNDKKDVPCSYKNFSYSFLDGVTDTETGEQVAP